MEKVNRINFNRKLRHFSYITLVLVLFFQIISVYYDWISVFYIKYIPSIDETILVRETYNYLGFTTGTNPIINSKYLFTAGLIILIGFYSSCFLSFFLILFSEFFKSKKISFLLILPWFLFLLGLLLYYSIIYSEVERFRSIQENLFLAGSLGIEVKFGFWSAILIFFLIIIISLITVFQYNKEATFSFDMLEHLESDINFNKRLIKVLLSGKECEYFDFKTQIYKIDSPDLKRKTSEKKEFIKDLLGLVNNKEPDFSYDKSFLLIGMNETDEKFNGIFQTVKTINPQPFYQLINEYIIPKTINIAFKEFFITKQEDFIKISLTPKTGYHRNYLIIIKYERGTVYELKKQLGHKKIGFFTKGMSFTRDGSHTRLITQYDRIKIMEKK